MHPCGKYTRGSAGVCLRTKGLRSVPTLARRRHGPLSSQEGVGRGFSHVTQHRYKAEGGASAPRGRCVRLFFEKAWSDRALRTGLVQLAHSATHTKGTYLATLFRRLAARRGKQRAMIAVAHSILVSVFSILVRHEPYRELGATHFDRLRQSQSVEHLTRRLEQ